MNYTEPINGVPMVRVLNEYGNEVMRGWYVFRVKRQPACFHDCLRPEDVEHCVVVNKHADWNMPREAKIYAITPPHTIEVISDVR